MQRLKIGIIGTGFGANIQAPNFMLHPDCEVVALSGVSRPGRAAEQAARLSIPRAYDDYREMLAREDLDLVSIASAPHLHLPMALDVMERGIPVLCEKPMALSLDEARAMCAAADQRGLLGAIDFEWRHQPARTRIKELLAEGFLGDLVHFNMSWTVPDYVRNWNRPMGWVWRAENGGGVLNARGSHLIDTLLWLFGDFDAVSSLLTTHVTHRQGEPVNTDDTFSFLVRLPGEATGVVQCLVHAHHGFGVRMEIWGTKGTLVLLEDRTLLAGRAGESLTEVPLPDHFLVPGVTYPAEPERHTYPFMVLVDNLVHAVRHTGAPGPSREYGTFRDGARVQAVLDALRRSHREGRWAEVERV